MTRSTIARVCRYASVSSFTPSQYSHSGRNVSMSRMGVSNSEQCVRVVLLKAVVQPACNPHPPWRTGSIMQGTEHLSRYPSLDCSFIQRMMLNTSELLLSVLDHGVRTSLSRTADNITAPLQWRPVYTQIICYPRTRIFTTVSHQMHLPDADLA